MEMPVGLDRVIAFQQARSSSSACSKPPAEFSSCSGHEAPLASEPKISETSLTFASAHP